MAVVTDLTNSIREEECRQYISQNDDPWFIKSVKDHLETTHIDGDTTTVRTKPKKVKVMSQTQKNINKTLGKHIPLDHA